MARAGTSAARTSRRSATSAPRRSSARHRSGLAELDEDAGGGARMEERDALAFRADPWRLVDEADAGGTAAVERAIEVVHLEADVMDAGPAPGDELADGALRRLALEELDERLAGGQPRDAGAIGVVQRHFGHAEDVAVEGQDLVEGADGDAHVGNTGRPRRGSAGNFGHGRGVGSLKRQR